MKYLLILLLVLFTSVIAKTRHEYTYYHTGKTYSKTPYIDGKLSLKQVAQKMEISTNYLSQVINENLKKNFFDFVNEYRVNLVKQKMKDPTNSQYTLLALAYDCGFNSKSSFNVIFKKNTGLTPSQYLKL